MDQPGVYILRSLKNGFFYVGSTHNISRRLDQHNKGWVKATKNNKPFHLEAFLNCSSLDEARKSERRLKKYKRRDILEKVINDKLFPWNYKRA